MRSLPSCLVALLVILLAPGLVHASGLGKFVQGSGKSETQECKTDNPVPGASVYRWRASAMLGRSDFAGADDPVTSLYLDGGYRFWDNTGGCSSRSGLFGGRSWSWYSLSVGLNSEVNLSDAGASSIGPMLAWDARRQTKGWLADFVNMLPVGVGATVGPYWRAGQAGVSASAVVRAIFDIRVAGHYEFDRGMGWSFHIGISDPHILIHQILNFD